MDSGAQHASKRKGKPLRRMINMILNPATANLTTAPLLLPKRTKMTDVAPWLTRERSAGLDSEDRTEIKVPQQSLSFPSPRSALYSADSGPYVSLLIGRQDPNSRYLTPQLFRVPALALRYATKLSTYYVEAQAVVAPPRIISLPELEPTAFALYYEYISSGTIVFPTVKNTIGGQNLNTCPWVPCWPLINAHILATAVGDARFGKFVLGLLRDKLELRQAPDPDTIMHIFTAKDVGKDLKDFVVNQAVAHGLRKFEPEQLELYPATFLHAALDRISELFLNLRREAKNKTHSYGSVGLFSHRDYEFEEMLRSIGEWVAFALMARKAQTASNELKANGIAVIDWANPCEAEFHGTLPGTHSGRTVFLGDSSVDDGTSKKAEANIADATAMPVSSASSKVYLISDLRPQGAAATESATNTVLPTRKARQSKYGVSPPIVEKIHRDSEPGKGPKHHRRKSFQSRGIANRKQCSPILEHSEEDAFANDTESPQEKINSDTESRNGIARQSEEMETAKDLGRLVPGAYPGSVAGSVRLTEVDEFAWLATLIR
ncbi:uncharacterized protein EI97DRAFT_455358 [Westerdykella ornata]|uniref:BTB domain-containing protein n=1 Tax=Westerdykella ornata TaxID=318751 RepID=A0A6A6JXC3_WESOR|nr:uncharacterized protein EI97DRAFT_455358 [Westerdykella ornata]KAF2280468.1 hypothetical protein EI97DRAFT_455358 [Westerdykella ornata]